VVLGTLVIQGLTVRPLLGLLKFKTDTSVEEEVSRGRVAIMDAAIRSLDGDESKAALVVRKQYSAARAVAENPEAPQAATTFDQMRLRAIESQRSELDRLRRSGAIGDEAYHRLQEEIDWAELDAAPAGTFQPLMT
jgi:hypothetical protein